MKTRLTTIVRTIVAGLVGLLGAVFIGGHSADAVPSVESHDAITYEYDQSYCAAPPNYTAPERGPPSHTDTGNASAGHEAGGAVSAGWLACSEGAGTTSTYTYNDSQRSAGDVSRSRADDLARSSRAGDSAHERRGHVAANTGRTAARACSFTGATTVLMAEGTHKPIEDIEIGDRVIATDPETGERVAKRVEHVFVHSDTVVDLVVDGEVIATTEDHPFWSVTDQRFERADELTAGEKVLGADGSVITVSGLKLRSARETLAYNLSVEGIHTYHVGEAEILVHNTCPINPSKYVRELEGGITRTYKKFTPARNPGEIAGARYVRETGPRGSRGWMESYDHSGRVRIVHPKGGEYPHYTFGPNGNYTGTRP